MATPITLQNLIDAATDAQTLSQVANSNALTVTSRLGTTYPTVYGALATIAAQAPNMNQSPFANVKDYGATGNGVTNDTNAFNAALNTGRALYVPNGRYNLGSWTVSLNNVTIIGEQMPGWTGDLTALTGGTILLGAVVIDGNNIRVENIGVDFGNAYSNTYNGGVGGNPLVLHNIAQAGTLNQNNHVRNVIGLCRIAATASDPTAAYHGVLLESLQYGSAYNVVGVNGWYGVVIKATDFNCDGVTGYNADTVGVFLRSNSYAPVERLTITNVRAFSYSARQFVGFEIDASDANVVDVAASNVSIFGGNMPWCIQGEGYGIAAPSGNAVAYVQSVKLSNVVSQSTATGANISGPVYDTAIDGVNISYPASGYGLTIGPNTVGVYPIDIALGTVRIVAPQGTPTTTPLFDLLGGTTKLSFAMIDATIAYVAPGLISLTGDSALLTIGNYFGILNLNLTTANLKNGWAVAYGGQAVASDTRNGVTSLYGRVGINSSITGPIVMQLPQGAFQVGSIVSTSALAYLGTSGTLVGVPVTIDASGNVTVTNYALYVGVYAYLMLNGISVNLNMPANNF